MTHQAVRNAFATFFHGRQHVLVPSSSLVPDNDPSVLLTTAGMQQLKPYFLGEKDATGDFGSRRLGSIQRCFRTSDIDEVGDATHNTFFEMVGNFSIGDYFKEEAIELAWEFLTSQLRISGDRLWATVFAGDELLARDLEAEHLWRKYIPVERIAFGPRADNFWGPAGATGPCGPSTEIHIDRTGTPCHKGADCKPNCVCGRFMELWNLVFTELEKTADGTFRPLKQKNIDTGMGLERLLLILQRKETIFETDVFAHILATVRHLDPLPDVTDTERAMRHRIVADHLRAACFLLADGVIFSNKDQGYILRRITRRAFDQTSTGSIDVARIVHAVVQTYGETAPHLQAQQTQLVLQLQQEQVAYQRILQQDVEAVVGKIRKQPKLVEHEPPATPSTRHLEADEAFQLYSTYGITPSRLQREGYSFDPVKLEALIAEHQRTSRAGASQKFGGHGLAAGHTVSTSGYSNEDVQRITRLHTATHLLHAALRHVLGDSVRQNGSDITPERLRFDFSFGRKLTEEEKQAVENLVNQKVQEDLPVSWAMMPYEKALAEGALAFFKDKYQPEVKVYTMGDFSKELCGGPHVEHTAVVGNIKILSEKSSSAGIRRIKAAFSEENP